MTNITTSPDNEIKNTATPDTSSLIDLYFQIHEKIHAKNEETQKSYRNNILVNFNDIKELHIKTIQSIKSLTQAKGGIGIRISVLHNEGETDKFNSFESFEKHNTTSPNPTSAISMVYSFSIYDQETQSFEEYKIQNLIKSRIAELKQIESEAPEFLPKEILASLITVSATIRIEYTDYVKARSFISMFDEWIKSCEEGQSNKFISNIKPFSHLITDIGTIFIYAILALSTVSALNTNNLPNNTWPSFIITYASFFLIMTNLTKISLKKLERSIYGHFTLSYLDINKGDAKLIKEYEQRNASGLKKAAIGLLSAILLGIISNATYDVVKSLIQ